MPSPPRVGVIYDKTTLAVRRVLVHEDHEDGDLSSEFSKNMSPGEACVVLAKSEVRGMQLFDLARMAILRATGREPPTVEEIHAKGL